MSIDSQLVPVAAWDLGIGEHYSYFLLYGECFRWN
jgi:hypothetical protein